MGKPLWAPWRIDYIKSEKPRTCIFCDMPAEDDDRGNYILHRGKLCYVILNLYPYNNAHIMIVPFRHTSDYSELDSEELLESGELMKKSIKAINEAFQPHGFNIGVNQGTAAGAGIEEHLHMHIVPRWNGDFNYMPVTGQTKVIPQHLSETYDILKPLFR